MNVATIRIKKLHSIVPEELFDELKELRMLSDIDNIVTQLLYDEVERRKESRGAR